jgi:phosphate transport system substrate-binding protein
VSRNNTYFKKSITKLFIISLTITLLSSLTVGCSKNNEKSIFIDGSSTVFPITEAIGEEYSKENRGVKITIGAGGTGAGIEKLIKGEVDIANASRHIKDEELEKANKANRNIKELIIANDGITIAVNKQNDWCTDITAEELKMIWEPNSKVTNWSDVRPEWPKEEIKLYGPGSESGTFEYFTEEITGEAGAIRTDYTASEDDNVLVTGVQGDKYSIGFFGFAYYYENTDKLKSVKVNGIEPTQETIQSGQYAPLSRALYLYFNVDNMNKKPLMKGFIEYYLGEGRKIVPSTGYVALPDEEYDKQLKEIESNK